MKTDENTIWYHGSDKDFNILKEGSTITQSESLARAFSHKPLMLSIEDDGRIQHDGVAYGYLYIITEQINIGVDVHPHPQSTMEENVEFLTNSPLQVKMLCHVGLPNSE